MDLNRLMFPRLGEYLDGLPQQLDSHPTALTKADFSLILRRRLDPVLAGANLPLVMKKALTAPWKQGEWIPTTHYVALCAIARDLLWQSPEAYHQGMFDVATEMYSGPVYRMLFFMLGPSIVALNATKRWDTLHQGTKLVVKKQQKESIQLGLSFPHKLFPELGIQGLGAAVCAIAEGSRGKKSTFTVVSLSAFEADMLVQWTY